MVAQNIAFGILSAAMVLAAILLVTTKHIVRAALFLIVVLAGAAAQFLLLASEFVAVVQVLVYIGAIVVLFLFGIMLTRAPIGVAGDLDNDQRGVSIVVALFLLGVLAFILVDRFPFEDASKLPVDKLDPASTGPIGLALFQQYVIPFEVISVLLTAALVGAIVVARRD
jgi:NADH-quinone oxidoreductase subunit J